MPTPLEIFVEGLDASSGEIKDHGWNAEHEKARKLLEAVTDLLAAAKHALPGCVGESEKLLRAAIAKAEQNQKGVPNG